MWHHRSRARGGRWSRLAALAAGLLGAVLAAGATWAPAREASPTAIEIPVGTSYHGECVLEGGRVDGRIAFWELGGVIPAFRTGGAGIVLAPPADRLPRLPSTPTKPFGAKYVLEPRLMASPLDFCSVRSFDPLQAPTVAQAGPHVFVQYDQKVSFIRAESGDDVTPIPCAENDLHFPGPSSDIPPPADLDDGKVWVVGSFCNTARIRGLHVKSTVRCPARGDMSRWPGLPYINQYDAGARLGLPLASGYRGGNASGPAALLMAMLRSGGPRGLPTLSTVYDLTMQRPRSAVRANQPNSFVAAKAVALLRSLGWSSARVRPLGNTVQQIQERLLTSLYMGPVVLSTAFGSAAWGVTGDENMIAVVGADPRGNFIVQDPAGNWFSSAKSGPFARGGHYGPGACGNQARYAHYWVLAYSTGRYLVELGPRTP